MQKNEVPKDEKEYGKIVTDEVARLLTNGTCENQIGNFHIVMNGASSGLEKLHPDESTFLAIERPSDNRVRFKLNCGHF